MNNLKKAAAVTLAAGGLAVAGAGMASAAHSGSDASGEAVGSPGVGSGNVIQAPIHVPGNVCGNTATAIGALNPAFDNFCVNR